MRMVEIYADETGETHIRDVTVSFTPRDFAPPSAPIDVSAEEPTTTGVFLKLPPGWDPEYHPTPRRQWVMMLSGHLKITTTDGSSVGLRPGDVVYLNDENSKGHQTLVQGDEEVESFLVGLAGRVG